ncbi:MAG: DJ-1 family protein [Gammaproteobacteria bacterium]|nr:MAG: DJ-1 family protein [Gammaproteobacteria bacterium]
MNPTVLIPLANGCEELEAVTFTDLLRRADINVITASLEENMLITASRGMHLTADTTLENVIYDDFDMIILPGGMPGTTNLNNSASIHAILKRMHQEKKMIAAICAAPLVLAHAGLLDGKKVTCFPGVLNPADWPSITISQEAIVIDEHLLTSQSPGTAMDFALIIIEQLKGKDFRDRVEVELVRTQL